MFDKISAKTLDRIAAVVFSIWIAGSAISVVYSFYESWPWSCDTNSVDISTEK